MTVTGIDALKVEVTELGVVTISINRPDRLNALDAPTVTALIEQITTHGADPSTRVLVLAGEGAAFTTGADLQAMAEAGDDAPTPDQTMDSAAALVRAVLTAPVPVIAAVNGPAAGVGVSLALASDLVFMAEDAYLLFAFTNIGLMPDGGASVLLPAQVGRAVASRMLLRGDAVPAAEAKRDIEKTGFAGIFSRSYLPGTILIGVMSFIGLLSTYGLNTWLPKIMQSNGASAHDSLYSLLFLNGGAVVGGLTASWIADKIGAKAVITSTFALAAASLAILPMFTSVAPMYPFIVAAGIGVIGTQVLTYGLSANYYGTASRAAGVSWVAGFGRLGGIAGPAIGGLIIGAGLGPTASFWIFAGAALVGAVATALIPRSPAQAEIVAEQAPVASKVDEPALS